MTPRRLAVLVALSMASAGCITSGASPDPVDDTGSTSDATSSGGSSPISTVTGATSSGGSGASDGASSSGDGGEETSGGAIDAAPTVALLVNGAAEPAAILQAGTQTITASVADDRGLARVEIFVDDAPEPLAEVALQGSTAEVVEVGLPIYDDADNGVHEVRAVVHDEAMQASASAPVSLPVDLPEGGSMIWESVGASKFASKALAVAVDSIGDVIAVGELSVSLDGHRSRMVIRKYDGESGELVWEREVPTKKEVQTPLGQNIARGVAVDAYDNVYVVGEVDPDGDSKPSRWLGKYTHDGLLARTHVSDKPKSRGNAVAVDEAGRVFAVGYRQGADLYDVGSVEVFDVGLTPLWSDYIAHADAFGVRMYGAAIDRHGDIVVVGSIRVAEKDWQGVVSLYAPDGARQWLRIASAAMGAPQDRLFSVVVNDDNEYIAAGRRAIGDDPRRLWLLRMGDDGGELASEADGYTHCGDPVFENDTDVCGVGRGPIGRLVWAGVAEWKSDDFQVKQTRDDWAIHLWAPNLDGLDHAVDRGLAVAADADGFVTAAGYETRLGAPRWWVTRRHP